MGGGWPLGAPTIRRKHLLPTHGNGTEPDTTAFTWQRVVLETDGADQSHTRSLTCNLVDSKRLWSCWAPITYRAPAQLPRLPLYRTMEAQVPGHI